jgi:hypothetical protein
MYTSYFRQYAITVSVVIGTICIVFGCSEAYGQTTTTVDTTTNTANTGGNNTFAEEILNCFFVNPPCAAADTTGAAGGASAEPINNQNTTAINALLGLSFNNVTLQDLQDNKETLKISLNQYLNQTIENMVSGQPIYSITMCLPIPVGPIEIPCPFPIGIIENPYPPIPSLPQD